MIRSVLFAIAFYLNSALFLVLGSWLLLSPRSWAMAALKAHGLVSVWLLRVIVGTRLEVRNHEKLPPGPVLVASKHQSAWDTFGLVPLMRDPAMIMKRELIWIPFYGWFSRKFRMIFVRRAAGPSALRRMARDAADRARDGREIIIFPEGTRRAPGAPPNYKPGVVLLYEALKIPCCPVALNSGLFWPRRTIRRYPGTIIVEFLDPIPPGLPRSEFLPRLQSAIETATDALAAEAASARRGESD
ncbi:MAG: lysophospholipid acyltransferase family protein [Methyloligellaceae bacterium]